MKRLFQPQNPSYIPVLSTWFGLLFGFAEVIYLSIIKFLLEKVIFQSQHFVWMIPLMLTILLAFTGFLLLIPALKWIALANPGFVTTFFVFPGLMALYYVKPRIHVFAALLLAAGIAVQAGRMVAKRPDVFIKLVRITLPVMAGVLLISMLVMLRFSQ